MNGPESTAVVLRLALSVLDGAPAQLVVDRLLTDVLDDDGAEGVLDIATTAVLTLAELLRAVSPDARAAALAGIQRCESATPDPEVP